MVGRALADAAAGKPTGSSVFTTRPLPPGEQFDAWRQFNAEVIDLQPVDEPAEAFPVDHWAWNMGGCVLQRTSLPVAIERRWQHRTKSHLDHWCIVIARGAGEGAAPPPVNVGVRSLTEPFEGRGQDAEVRVLYMPRDRCAKAAPTLDQSAVATLSPGCRAILVAHIDHLVREIENVPQEAWPALADATCSLILACLAPTKDAVAEAERPIFSALRERARRIVRANMASPDFDPDALARLLFVSRSKLYRIFEPSGGVARFIQRERLGEAHHRLTEETSPISICNLATVVGFRDHSAFSRAFKNEYGCSPREAREEALACRLVSGPVEAEGSAWSDLENCEIEERPVGPSSAWTEGRLPIRGESWKNAR